MSETSYYKKQFSEKYAEFLTQIKVMYGDGSDVNLRAVELEKINDDVKADYGKKFNSLLCKNTTFKNYLLNRKIKLFSSKNKDTQSISYSLLNTIPLKKLLNGNITENTKNVIWEFIQLLYVFSELSTKEKGEVDKQYIKDLLNCVETLHSKEAKVEVKEESRSSNKNILNLDVNPETNNMINDIVSMFQDGMEDGEDANPFKNIVEVTKKITENYQGKIEKGEIDLDGLLSNIQKSMPDMPDISKLDLDGKSEEEIKHIIDEEFSTADVKVGDRNKENKSRGMDLGGMMKMMSKMTEGMGGGKDGEPDMNNLNKLMESMGNMTMPKTEEEAKEQSDKMRKMLSDQFNVDLSELDKLQEDLTNRNEGDELNEKDFDKISGIMGNMLNDIKKNDDETDSKSD